MLESLKGSVDYKIYLKKSIDSIDFIRNACIFRGLSLAAKSHIFEDNGLTVIVLAETDIIEYYSFAVTGSAVADVSKDHGTAIIGNAKPQIIVGNAPAVVILTKTTTVCGDPLAIFSQCENWAYGEYFQFTFVRVLSIAASASNKAQRKEDSKESFHGSVPFITEDLMFSKLVDHRRERFWWCVRQQSVTDVEDMGSCRRFGLFFEASDHGPKLSFRR